MTIDVQRNHRRTMPKTTRDRQDIQAGVDQHACVGMAQAVQRDRWHADCRHSHRPSLRDRIWAKMPTINRSEYGGVLRSLPKACRETLLLLLTPVLAQFRHKMRRQRDRP